MIVKAAASEVLDRCVKSILEVFHDVHNGGFHSVVTPGLSAPHSARFKSLEDNSLAVWALVEAAPFLDAANRDSAVAAAERCLATMTAKLCISPGLYAIGASENWAHRSNTIESEDLAVFSIALTRASASIGFPADGTLNDIWKALDDSFWSPTERLYRHTLVFDSTSQLAAADDAVSWANVFIALGLALLGQGSRLDTTSINDRKLRLESIWARLLSDRATGTQSSSQIMLERLLGNRRGTLFAKAIHLLAAVESFQLIYFPPLSREFNGGVYEVVNWITTLKNLEGGGFYNRVEGGRDQLAATDGVSFAATLLALSRWLRLMGGGIAADEVKALRDAGMTVLCRKALSPYGLIRHANSKWQPVTGDYYVKAQAWGALAAAEILKYDKS